MSNCLVIFHKQLGDLVLIEPALRRLAETGDNTVDLITRSGFLPLSSLMPYVNFRSKPSAKRYDMLWCFDDRPKSAFFSFVSRARKKRLLVNPGASLQWYHPKIFPTILAPDLGRSHISEYYWKHVAEANRGSFRPPQLETPPKDWACPISSRNYLHVNPTSGWKSKNWTAEKWAMTINRLAEYGIGPIVMTSGTQDWQMKHCEAICRKLNKPVESFAGKTNIEKYLWIIWNAKAVVTVDGSASHIAAAFKRKCVTLFGHTSATSLHKETTYSKAVIAEKKLGAKSPRLVLLPHEPVIKAVVNLWHGSP